MKRFVKMFKPEFVGKIETGQKNMTIRPKPVRMPAVGDLIDIRQWAEKPYRSPQIKVGSATLIAIQPIVIDWRWIELNGRRCRSRVALDAFAVGDGFESWGAMVSWFQNYHSLPFHGIRMAWENFKKEGA